MTKKNAQMNTAEALVLALRNGKARYEEIIAQSECPGFCAEEIYNSQNCKCDSPDMLASADNLAFMEYLLKGRDMAGKLQLIYVDPPFFSNSRYQASVRLETDKLGKSAVIKTGAYEDRWGNRLDKYLEMLAVRFMLMRDLLSDTGCIWVHLDWHGSHYVKMLLDEIFGMENFVNEVCWTYKSGGASKKSFARKHDTLLFYGKTKKHKFHPLKEKSYNRGLKPYRFKGVEEFQDETGWYTMVNMKDVWNIDMVGRTSSERTGYATQKPEKLLERILESCTDEGDLVADFFSGSGTTGAVAARLGRRWIMCDEGNVATAGQIIRLTSPEGGKERPFEVLREESVQNHDTAGSALYEKSLGCLRLTDYKPDTMELSRADQDIAADYICDDGRSAIHFWTADYNYDGRVHRGGAPVCKEDFDVMPDEHSAIHIVGYDVFGNRFTYQL